MKTLVWLVVVLSGISLAVTAGAQSDADPAQADRDIPAQALLREIVGNADVDLQNREQRMGYALGVNMGRGLTEQNLLQDIDLDAFLAGMLDAVHDDVRLADNEIMATLQQFMQRQQQVAQAALADNLAASEAFLATNGSRAGVVTLASGLQYEILQSGPADGASPSAANSVLAHYHGTLADGSVFDSSVERGEPATFSLAQVIPGWTEALQLMKTGDKWRLFIPPALAYGEASPSPAIPPNSALVFEVELLEIR